ncbi:MAG TPA: response regulator [Dissulfurispiraceae bacterium]|nr:response regulator [Dissulfurispiraceae bacterium]
MNDLIAWLVQLEQKSGELYKAASAHFSSEPKLSEFLSNLADDESLHMKVMEDAAVHFHKDPQGFHPAVRLDEETKSRIEIRLSGINKKLDSGEIAGCDMIEHIVSMEFSEWNDIFLYVIDLLKKEGIEYQTVASKIQAHIDRVETFVRAMPDGQRYVEMIMRLPHVWTANILVVDNEPSIARFLSMLLEKEGQVHVAENGKAALEKMNERYFDVILSDLNMPVMDGIDFFMHAAEKEPDIGKKFIFFSGGHDQKQLDFFEKNRLRYLLKPASINEIMRNVREILDAAAVS